MICSVVLDKVVFYGYHGLYPEEKALLQPFIVNVEIFYTNNSFPIVDINHTIDYSQLYAHIQKRMQIPTLLLETICSYIIEDVFCFFSLAEETHVSIQKNINQVIEQSQGQVLVCLKAKRNEILSL